MLISNTNDTLFYDAIKMNLYIIKDFKCMRINFSGQEKLVLGLGLKDIIPRKY